MSARQNITRKRTNVTKSNKAGLVFPVGRIHRLLKKSFGTRNYRVSVGAAVYAAAALEYLTAEVVELAGSTARAVKRKLVTPRHIMLSVHGDQEMSELLSKVTIPSSGVVPRIHVALLPKKGRGPPKTAGATPKPSQPKKAPRKAVAQRTTKTTKKVMTKPPPLKKATSVSKKTAGQSRGVSVLSEKTLFLGQKLTVLQGDITNVSVEAVVHPTNASYFTGGEVGQALQRKGGQEFTDEINRLKSEKGSLAVGEAAVCGASGIPAKYVVHVNSPTWGGRGGGASSAISALENAVTNVFKVAESKKVEALALPSIGSGNAGFPKQAAAETILRAIHTYFAGAMQSSIKRVYFVLYDMESVGIYTSELAKLV